MDIQSCDLWHPSQWPICEDKERWDICFYTTQRALIDCEFVDASWNSINSAYSSIETEKVQEASYFTMWTYREPWCRKPETLLILLDQLLTSTHCLTWFMAVVTNYPWALISWIQVPLPHCLLSWGWGLWETALFWLTNALGYWTVETW